VSSAALFGLNGVLTHWFTVAGGQTITLLALRFVAGGVVFGTVAVARAMRLPPLREAGAAVVTGLGHVGFTACLLWGFATSSVALTVLLFYTNPLLVALGAAALYGEPLTRGRLLLIGLGAAGVALAVGTPTGATRAGILFGLGAGFGCSAVILGNRALLKRGVRVEQLATVSYLAPAICFGTLALAGALPAPPATVEALAPALAY
jgi:drug/metabolite transporter (DMT)-like permease